MEKNAKDFEVVLYYYLYILYRKHNSDSEHEDGQANVGNTSVKWKYFLNYHLYVDFLSQINQT